jgi:N-hydroxyarylamine O-acetyltransferase
MDLDAYLARIGYGGPVRPDLETLRGMHRAHYFNVPFENLDIRRGTPIVVDVAANYKKIVGCRRGGWCLELTAVFAWALSQVGFRIDVLSGRALYSDGQLGPPHTHMVVLVHLAERWLADVGFGGRGIEPLRLDAREPQIFDRRCYVVANDGEHYFVTVQDPWVSLQAPRTYLFTLEPREWQVFAPGCEWLQTSPQSMFTRGDIATLALPQGRVTYSAGRLLITEGDTHRTINVAESEFPSVMAEKFGIVLSPAGALAQGVE